jgi:hypothetical protein
MSWDEISIVTFRAGPQWLAVAAGAVSAIGPLVDGAPHVDRVLGHDGDVDISIDGRGLTLAGRRRRGQLNVDGPVALDALTPGQVLRVAPGLPRAAIPVVLGFAHAADRILLLLDVERVLDRLSILTAEARPSP